MTSKSLTRTISCGATTMCDDERDLIERTFDSTERFHQLFKGALPTVLPAAAALREEHDEVQVALLSESKERLVEELADLFYTMAGAALSRGISPAMLKRAMREVIRKNGKKNWQTHWVTPEGTIKSRTRKR